MIKATKETFDTYYILVKITLLVIQQLFNTTTNNDVY